MGRLFNKFFGAIVFVLPGIVIIGFALFVEIPRSIDNYTFAEDISEYLGIMALGAVAIFIGYLQISDSAGRKAQFKYAQWNKGFRVWFTAFLLVGLITLLMSMYESTFYLFFGIPFSLIGAFGLYNFYSKERIKKELPKTGKTIECTNISVEQDSLSSGYLVDTNERLSPYKIKCFATEPSSNIPLVFVSEFIWFDPKPFIRESIVVYVNPNKNTEYVVDTSFLPKETRKIIEPTSGTVSFS